ncbi:MAG: hypothetical protein AABX97_01125, partial [Candidatus Thermoplasmatota archaeon]
AICTQTQLGVRSKAWAGGRFSTQEPLVYDLDKYYMETMTGKSDLYLKPAARKKASTSRKRREGGS